MRLKTFFMSLLGIFLSFLIINVSTYVVDVSAKNTKNKITLFDIEKNNENFSNVFLSYANDISKENNIAHSGCGSYLFMSANLVGISNYLANVNKKNFDNNNLNNNTKEVQLLKLGDKNSNILFIQRGINNFFDFDKHLTKAEFLVLIFKLRGVYLDGYKVNTVSFADVDLNSWYAPYFDIIKKNNWIEGDIVDPNKILNTNEAIDLFNKIFNKNLKLNVDIKPVSFRFIIENIYPYITE